MDSYDNSGAVIAIILAVGLLWLVIVAAIYVVTSIFYARLFAKAGVQGKWRAWVPVYREMIFGKLGDLNPWWFLILIGASFILNLIPYIGPLLGWIPSLASVVYLALAAYRVGLKLQKEAAWVILYVFLSVVWLGIVAFDKSHWSPAVRPAPWANSFLADKTVWQGIPSQDGVAPGYTAPGYGAPSAPGYAPPAAPGAYPPPAPGAYPPPSGDVPPAPPAPPADSDAPRV